MEEKKCRTCGSNLLSVGNGAFRCLFCGNGYAESVSGSNVMERSEAVKLDHGADVFENNIGGILEITWSDEQYLHSGSGFLITNNGYALTNTHVVTQEDGTSVGRVRVKMMDAETSATVVSLGDDFHGSGNGVDLALIRLDQIPRGAKVLSFADFESVRIGEKVFVIGNSLGYGTCITSGIVSDKLRNVDGHDLMMTDCAVNGGNSGGPIFNEKGLVIGVIVSGITGAEGMNFAIPANTAQAFCKRSGQAMAETKATTQINVQCPKCGGRNCYDADGKFRWCGDCDYEW